MRILYLTGTGLPSVSGCDCFPCMAILQKKNCWRRLIMPDAKTSIFSKPGVRSADSDKMKIFIQTQNLKQKFSVKERKNYQNFNCQQVNCQR